MRIRHLTRKTVLGTIMLLCLAINISAQQKKLHNKKLQTKKVQTVQTFADLDGSNYSQTTILANRTTENLDAQHGFKELILGDDFSKWKSQIIYSGPSPWQWFIYHGSLDRKIFQFNIDHTELLFSNNKLVMIVLLTKPFHPTYDETGDYPNIGLEDYNGLMDSFDFLYGMGSRQIKSEPNKEIKSIWIGSKTVLITEYNYLGINKGGRAKITIADFEYVKQM